MLISSRPATAARSAASRWRAPDHAVVAFEQLMLVEAQIGDAIARIDTCSRARRQAVRSARRIGRK